MQSIPVTHQLLHFAPLPPSMPPLFPFSLPPLMQPQPMILPVHYTDSPLNLPASPSDRIFQFAYRSTCPRCETHLLCTTPTILTYTQPITQSSTAFSLMLPSSSLPPQSVAGGSAESFTEEKPPYSYTGLAALAINSHPERKATLPEIYSFIALTFPYYKRRQAAWKNSIRYSLQHTDCFMPVCDRRGKCYWTVDSNSKTHVLKGSFKARKHSCTVNREKKTLKELNEESREYFEPSRITSIPNTETDIVDLFPPDNYNDTSLTLVSITIN